MKKNILIKTLAIALAAAVLLSFAGCGNKLNEVDVSYAGPMLDTILSGIKDNDYAEFSKDFDDAMKAAETQTAFASLASMLKDKIGDYQSKTFSGAVDQTKNNIRYTTVVYKAKYTKETGDVLITVAFSESSGTKKVTGLWFSSPNLLKK